MSLDETVSDDEPPAHVDVPRAMARRRRGAVSVSGDTLLTSKQHSDCRQAILVSLGPKRSKPLLKMFEAVRTVQMAQQFLARYDRELGVLGKIQAATTLSTSLSMFQAGGGRIQSSQDTKDAESMQSTVETCQQTAVDAAEPTEDEKVTASEVKAARAALKKERTERRAQQQADAKKRAARKALGHQSRALLAAREKELTLAENRLRGLDRWLRAIADEEAEILRQLNSGLLTADQRAALLYRLEMLRTEKERLASQRKKILKRIARLESNIDAILAGDTAQPAASNTVGESDKPAGDRSIMMTSDMKPQRNPYKGTRFDPGEFHRTLGASGLAFSNPLQRPSPPPAPEPRPGSAMKVCRTPSAEDRLDKHRKLLASERQARNAELRYIQPPVQALRIMKVTRRWQRVTIALLRRHAVRAVSSDRCVRLPHDIEGIPAQNASITEINAARNVWCGTPRSHPFFEQVHATRQRRSIPTASVPASVAYDLWNQHQKEISGEACEQWSNLQDPSSPVDKRPQSAPMHAPNYGACEVDLLSTECPLPQECAASAQVEHATRIKSSAAEDSIVVDTDSEMDVWQTIEHQIKCEEKERRIHMEKRSRAPSDLFQTGGTNRIKARVGRKITSI